MKYKVTKETITRTVINAVALLNILLVVFNKVPLDLDESLIYDLVSCIALAGANIQSWWKNNSFTPAAIKADEYMKQIKYEESGV